MQAAERDCLEATECVRSCRTYTMAKDRASGVYAGVTLIESATRGHNGRTCTVIKFVIPRVTLIENFASRKTVKEKLNDRRIAEPPMDESSKKIRELTEAMRA